jgi:hypothetical protein
MSITLKIDQSTQISIFITTDKISSSEIIEAIESFYNKKLGRKVLWDFRYAYLDALIFSNELENIAVSFFKSNRKLKKIGKTAIVASADLWFSFAKMYSKFIKIRDLSQIIQVCRFNDEAINWLLDTGK